MFSFDEIALKIFAHCLIFFLSQDTVSLERAEAWTLVKGGSVGGVSRAETV